tara:strand:- start:394 stop:606 length:213 start_codon:yes stop_codon:yes gene_type:complete
MPNKVTPVIVRAPYVAYVNPTGIMLIAFATQYKHTIIVETQNTVGPNFVNPSVVLRSPLETIPVIIANAK